MILLLSYIPFLFVGLRQRGRAAHEHCGPRLEVTTLAEGAGESDYGWTSGLAVLLLVPGPHRRRRRLGEVLQLRSPRLWWRGQCHASDARRRDLHVGRIRRQVSVALPFPFSTALAFESL